MQRTLVPIGIAALLSCWWLGCSSPATDGTSNGGAELSATVAAERPAMATPSLSDRRLPWTPANDLELVDWLAVHHRQAIRMAEAVLARGVRVDVRALALLVRDTRQDQLDVLMASRNALVGSVDVTDVPWDPHVTQTLKAMDGLSGGALERTFLIEMIAHDGAEMGPALRAQANLLRPELQALAQQLYEGELTEVAEMSAMLGDDSLASVHGGAQGGLGPFGDPRVPFTPANDVQLIDYWVSRHLEAIAMADLVLAYGADPDVHTFAMQMKGEMTAQVATMRAARFPLTGVAEIPTPVVDRRVETTLKVMRTLTGTQLDRLFLEEMMPHHGDGLAPAVRALHEVGRGDLRSILVGIVEKHSAELGAMQHMRSALGPGTPGGL